MTELTNDIRANIDGIRNRIDKAAQKSGRKPADVQLMAVTKKKSADVIRALYEGGIRSFGENYPDETQTKQAVFEELHLGIELSMIGHLQSRKLDLVCKLFDSYHALNRLNVATRLNKTLMEIGKKMPVMIEINIGDEPNKHGWAVDTENNRQAYFTDLAEILKLPNLEVYGLMSLPPYFENPEQTRPYFIKLRELREETEKTMSIELPHLSIGTSVDFEIAIEEGATWVRVGTALTGPRV